MEWHNNHHSWQRELTAEHVEGGDVVDTADASLEVNVA